ncbi:reverse transcriptase domain-containing protein [Tanacetum coccineum]
MSSDSAVTYTSVHSEARSWSIPSEDPYEEAARQLLEQAPRPSEYVPDPMELEDHVPVYIPEPEHPEDLVPAEDEAPIEPYITEPWLRGELQTPSIYHLLLPAGTPPLLPIPLPAPSTSRRADIPEADTPPRKRLLLTAPTPRVEVGESSAAAAARQPGSTMARRVDHSFVDTVDTRVRDTERRTMAAIEVVNLRVSYQADVRRRESLGFYSRHQEAQEDRAAVRAEIEILRRERLIYEQESIETRQALDRSEAYSRALEAWIRVLETQAYRHETMETVNQGMSVEEIEQIVAQRVANAIEAIAIYESINQTKQQVFWVHAVGPNNKKYVGSLPLCNKCKCHHNGPCTVKYGNWKKKYAGTLPLCTKCNYHHKGQCAPKCNICKKIGHLAQNCRTPAAAEYQRTLTCYECGGLGHYKRDCPELKNQNHGNQAGSMEARGVVHAFGGGETKQDLNNIEDEIEA